MDPGDLQRRYAHRRTFHAEERQAWLAGGAGPVPWPCRCCHMRTGGLWSQHHRLLDPLETHGRRLPAANLWFLLSVSLLPYWVNVLASYPDNNAAAGMFVLWLGVAQASFLLVCVAVRRKAGTGGALDELIVPKMIRAANAAAWLGLFGGLLVAQVQVPEAAVFVWLLLLVAGGRGAVRLWSARHRRRVVGG